MAPPKKISKKTIVEKTESELPVNDSIFPIEEVTIPPLDFTNLESAGEPWDAPPVNEIEEQLSDNPEVEFTSIDPIDEYKEPFSGSFSGPMVAQRAVLYTDGLSGDADSNLARAYGVDLRSSTDNKE